VLEQRWSESGSLSNLEFAKAHPPTHPKAVERLDRHCERMVSFYNFPEAHSKHLRTTNIVESPFAAVRLPTGAEKRIKKVANATALIWKMLLVVEQNSENSTHHTCSQKSTLELTTTTASAPSPAHRSSSSPDAHLHTC
jgi:transposase-like protein